MSTSTYLMEERHRLQMTQAQFAALAGVTSKTQGNYESGLRSPDADYLAALAKHGVDVQYVVTGLRGSKQSNDAVEDTVSIEEWRVLIRYRNAPNLLKAAALQVLLTRVTDLDLPLPPIETATGSSTYITGGGGYMIHSPVTTYNQQGDVNVSAIPHTKTPSRKVRKARP